MSDTLATGVQRRKAFFGTPHSPRVTSFGPPDKREYVKAYALEGATHDTARINGTKAHFVEAGSGSRQG